MKCKLLIVFVLICSFLKASAENSRIDSSSVNPDYIQDTDSLLDKLLESHQRDRKSAVKRDSSDKVKGSTVATTGVTSSHKPGLTIPAYIEPIKIDSLILEGNPFFIDLVFMGYPNNFKFEINPDYQTLLFGHKPFDSHHYYIIPPQHKTDEQIISELRFNAREELCRTAVHLFVMSYDELPDPNGVKSRFLQGKSMRDMAFAEDNKMPNITDKKLIVKKEKLGPWRKKANGMVQFSQNMATDNWYQGGSSNMAVLGILTGQLNYDNKKGIQWENNAEWRMGFNAVFNDPNAKRDVSVNDDVIKANSKLGIRASENFFYSTSVDFSTQMLKNYKNINSTVLKSAFLSPVRFNVGVGVDYKYNRSLSLMLAPVSYKYIYVLETDPKVLDPNLFGIKTGENHLSEIGSSFRAQYSYSPFRELQVDTRLSFYTNYQKVEIDWEIVGNFAINRFLSTRLLLNPRYDNTVIGEKAKIQFKELLSFGFSYKLLN